LTCFFCTFCFLSSRSVASFELVFETARRDLVFFFVFRYGLFFLGHLFTRFFSRFLNENSSPHADHRAYKSPITNSKAFSPWARSRYVLDSSLAIELSAGVNAYRYFLSRGPLLTPTNGEENALEGKRNSIFRGRASAPLLKLGGVVSWLVISGCLDFFTH